MRFIKVLLLGLCIFLGGTFFVQNLKELSAPLALKLDLFVSVPSFGAKAPEAVQAPVADPAKDPRRLYFESKAVPFYFVVISSFALGMLFATFFFFMSRVRMGMESMVKTREIKALRKELTDSKLGREKDIEAKEQQILALESAALQHKALSGSPVVDAEPAAQAG